MTVKEKIFILNADFQKFYYDKDIGSFNRTIPKKLEDIKNFILSIVPAQHALYNSIQKHLELIEYELQEFKNLSAMNSASYCTKDNYLNSAKQNISQALWRFHDDLWRYNSKLLEQQIPDEIYK